MITIDPAGMAFRRPLIRSSSSPMPWFTPIFLPLLSKMFLAAKTIYFWRWNRIRCHVLRPTVIQISELSI
jgi:hypothetical protein